MSAATATMLLNETLYAFERGLGGEGYWFCREGSCEVLNGSNNANMRVPIAFANDLTDEAKERGIKERYNFARNIPEPVKEKRVRGPRKPKEPANPLMGGFNPFKMGK